MDIVVGCLIGAALCQQCAIWVLRRRLHELETNILRLALVRRQQPDVDVPVDPVKGR